MIFVHKPYYNPNYTNPNKKYPSDICPKPKKLYKLYNEIIIIIKEHRKKNQNLNHLNYKYLLTERKYLNLKKKSNQFHIKPKIYYVSYLCVISPT
jgi:hypothetical protein